MFITKHVAAAADVPARHGRGRRAAAARRDGAGADGAGADRGAAAPRFGAVYVPNGAIVDAVDAGHGRRRLRVHADPEAARAVQRLAGRRQQPDAVASGQSVEGDHAVSAAGWLTGVLAEADRGRGRAAPAPRSIRSSRKQIGQDTPFPSLELATEDFTGYVGACTPRLQLRLHEHDLVELADDAAADGDQSARGVRAAVRRGRHARRSARARMRAQAQHPRFDRRGGRRAAARRSGARDRARVGEYLDNMREIERRIQRTEAHNGTERRRRRRAGRRAGLVRGARRR